MSLKKLDQKALSHIVYDRQNGRYHVVSGGSGKIYDVVLRGRNIRECNCHCGYLSSSLCSHILAVARFVAVGRGYKVIGLVRQDEKPKEKHFRLNYNSYLIVEEMKVTDLESALRS